ncbi:hypothetical protein K2X89_12285, partial [Myxococcota bacterium]|nr:hypothetical protein [Myxococcota bacterium]
FASSAICLAETPADEQVASAQVERDALLAFLKSKGIELRVAAKASNVIDHLYSVGPDHENQDLVGLSYRPEISRHSEVIAKYPIAVPFVMNHHWLLWQVGGPRGNATKEYLAAWERVRTAFESYSSGR